MGRYYYYRRYYRRRYRRYLRRYLYKKNKKYANRVSLNYYKAKIQMEFAVYHANNQQGTAGAEWVFGDLDWHNPTDRLILAPLLREDAEYKLYIPIYDSVRLLAVGLQALPTARNQNLNAGASHQPITIQYKKDASVGYSSPLILNPQGYSKKYWRNYDLKWSPVALTAAEIANNISLPGQFILNGVTDTTLQNASPSWNLMVTIYLQFKKNKNN